MKKFFVLFLVSMTSIFFVVSETEDDTCDYTFGDPTWNFTKVFFDEDIRFPAGVKEYVTILPGQSGLRTSYVCINFPDDVDKNTTTAAYHPIDRKVSVALARETTRDFSYHVLAKRHGY